MLPDEQLFGAESSSGGWGQSDATDEAPNSDDDIQLQSTTEEDESRELQEAALDVWEEATQLGGASGDPLEGSPGTVVHGSDVVDEDAEWRQVARAEMLEEYYRGMHGTPP